MTTKDIRASAADAHTSCDVCGRTLLRGEHAHPYLDGTTHRSVCELCTSRAAQEGWIREGTVPAYDGRDSGSDRRRSLLGRLRKRRDDAAPADTADYDDEDDGQRWSPPPPRPTSRIREPRHVRAIPSGADQKVSVAIDAFNASEYPRTVAGIARSLGLPIVSVRPVAGHPSLVNIVAAWELTWYRYEIDLAEGDRASVRVAAQGDELSELREDQLEENAVCDDRGLLALGS